MNASLNKIVSFLFFFLFLNALHAQDCKLVLYGTLRDAASKDALPFAHITLISPHRHVISDADGKFSFDNLCLGNYEMTASMIGFATKNYQLKLSQNEHFTFEMFENTLDLKEIIIKENRWADVYAWRSNQTTLISGQSIRSSGAINLASSLANTAGVSAINTGVGISKPVIRGMSLSRVVVNNLGVKQEDQQWGADHGLQIDPNSVSEIELVKGSAALKYGGDAMGGVINLLPPLVPKKGLFSWQNTYQSNNDLFGTSISFENKIKNSGFFYRARLSHQNYGDYKVPASEFVYNKYILPLFDNSLKNTAGRDYNAQITLGKAGETSYFSITASYFKQLAGIFAGAMGIPRAYQMSPDGDSRNVDLPRQNSHHFKIIFNYRKYFKDKYYEIDAGFQENYRREESLPHAHGQGITPSGNLGLGLRLFTLSANLSINKEDKYFSYAYGTNLQAQKNAISGYEFLIPNYVSTNVGGFYTFLWHIKPKWSIDGGIRTTFFALKSEKYTQNYYNDNMEITRSFERAVDLTKVFFNLSASTGFSYKMTEKTILKTQIGLSSRVPNVAEMASNGVHHGTFRHELGNNEMNSERGWQINLSTEQNFNNLTWNLSPFYYYFDNYIYLSPSALFSTLPEAGQMYVYKQSRVYMYGAEANLTYRINKYMNTKTALEYVFNQNLDTTLPLPFTPPFSALQEITFSPTKDFDFNFSAHYFAAQNRTDRNEKPNQDYLLFDAKLNYKLSWKARNFDVVLLAKNLFDTKYINHLSRYKILNLPEQGRNFMISLKMAF